MFRKATLAVLDELTANNSRAWFEANKARHQALARGSRRPEVHRTMDAGRRTMTGITR